METTVKGATVKIGGDTTGLENALKSTNKEIGHIGTELKTVERLLKLDPGNVILVAQKQELLTKSIEETTKKLNNLRESQEKVEQQAAKGDIGQEQFRAFQREIEKTRLKLDDLEEEKKSFDAIADSTDKATKSIINLEDESKSLSDMSTHFEKAETKVKSLNNELPNTHKGMENIGKAASATMKVIGTAIVALSTAMVAAGGFGIKVGMDFEEGMSSVASISGATGDELDRLTEKAKQMGADTKFSATQSAQAFEYMAMAGWKTGDMLSGIEGVMNLAAASGEELGLVSDIVTDSLTAFGLQAKDSARFSDVLAKASSASNTNVALMGNTFQYVAPLAGAMGYSIEDTAVAIGLMANSGIKGEKAGTALRGMLTRLMAPTSDVSGAMDELGISILNTDGTVKPLNQTMVELRGKFANLTDAEQAQYAATLAGKEAMSGFLSIVNASEGDFQKLTAEINNSSGAAQTMADIRMDNLKGDIDKLKSATEGLGIQFYESIDNGLRGAVQAGTKSIDELAEAFESGGLEGAIDKAGEIIGDFVTEIASQSPGMVRSATKLIKAFVGSIKENKTELVRAGKDIVISLADGIGDIVPVLKPVTSAIGFLAENFESVLKVVIPLTGAFVALKVVVPIVTTLSKTFATATTIMGMYTTGVSIATISTTGLGTANTILGTIMALLTGKITLATTAQWLWNAAVLANPVGAVAATLGAIIGSIIIYNSTIGDTITESDKLASAAKLTTEKLNDEAKAFNDLQTAQNEQADADIAQIDNAKLLFEQLKNITDENGKVKEANKARAEFITGELNTALGTELELTGQQIKGYQDLVKNIDDVVLARKGEILLEANKEVYTEAIKKAAEAKDTERKSSYDLLTAEQNLKAAQDELTDAKLGKINELTKAVEFGTRKQILEKEGAVKKELDNYNIIKKQNDDAAANFKLYTDTIVNYENAYVAAKEGNSKKVIDSLVGEENAFKNAKDVSTESVSEQKEILGQQYADCLLDVDNYVKKYGASTDQKHIDEIKALQTQATNAKEEARKVGAAIVDGSITGVDGKSIDLKSTIESLFKNAVGWAQTVLGVNSPSKVMRDKVGKPIPKGVAVGIDQEANRVFTSMDNLSKGTIKKAQKSLTFNGVNDIDKIFKDMSRSFATMPLATPTNFPTPRTAAAYIPTMQRTGNRQAPTAPPTIAHITIELNRRVLGEIMTPIISQNINANTATDRRSRGSK